MGEVQKISDSIDSIVHRKGFLKETSMDYRKSIGYRKEVNDDSSPKQLVQRSIAEKLLKELGEPKSWKFYLKCAYHLPEEKIWDFVDKAKKPWVNEKNRLFVYLANREMNK